MNDETKDLILGIFEATLDAQLQSNEASAIYAISYTNARLVVLWVI